MNPMVFCFSSFSIFHYQFDLIHHSEYPLSKVPLNKSTHRSFWAICFTFTSSFHRRSPRTTCRREPGNSVFFGQHTPPSNGFWHRNLISEVMVKFWMCKKCQRALWPVTFSPFSQDQKKKQALPVQLAIHPGQIPALTPAASWRRPWDWSNVAKISCHSIKISEASSWSADFASAQTMWICMSPNFKRLHWTHENAKTRNTQSK